MFDLDEEAKAQLRDDVKNQKHKTMTPTELLSEHKVYQKYKKRIFKQRIYQEVRRIKFINWLEMKRTEKRDEFAKKKKAQKIKFDEKAKKKEEAEAKKTEKKA